MTHRPALVLVAALLLLCALSCSAKTVYVKLDSPGPTFDGRSWDTALHTVQVGLNTSVSGDEVWVAKGTYAERITLKSGVGLYGGFLGAETSRDQRNWSANVTILDGNRGGAVVGAPFGATGNTRIDGFTIRNGRSQSGGGMTLHFSSPTVANNAFTGNAAASAVSSGYGGAIFCHSSSPSIIDNRFVGNSASGSGGGLCCQSSSPTIADNIFTGNSALAGGAVYCHSGSSPTIDDNTITGNSASTHGGGIYSVGSVAVITNNTVTENTSTSDGGGVYCVSSSATITHNTISGNAGRNGGGVHCSASSSTIANNTISGNTASFYGGGIYCHSGSPSIVSNTVGGNGAWRAGGMYFFDSSPALSDNIIGFNSSGILTNEGTPVLRNNCVYGNTEYDYSGISAGTGDISDDPLLVNAALGDYHLRPDSPCINAGWNDAPGLPLSDMDGEPRIVHDIADIGADEFPLGTCLGYTKPIRDGGSVSLSDIIVSAAFGGSFYIEAEDRSAGIRVEKVDHGLNAGDRVTVTGSLGTNDDGERFIEAASVVAGGIGDVASVGLPNRSVGGAGWFYNPGTGAGQRGVKEWRPVKSDDTWVPTLMDSTGMNNIGLLARTWGKVTYLGDIYFYLDDGSKLDDGSGHIGVKVTTEGLTMPALDSYVKVTGASSCYKRDGDLFRLIRATEIAPV